MLKKPEWISIFCMAHSFSILNLAIVTALSCEAKPIISFYKLKKLDKKLSFPIYYHENIYLIVSGIGKINAAIAVAMIKSLLPDTDLTWLNIGIAGHRDYEVGNIFLGHKIIDQSVLKAYYPAFLDEVPLQSSIICTVDKPELQFNDDYIYEMEASGFMQAALKFSTIEYIQCCKIISDNLKDKICLNGCAIQTLIENKILEISKVIGYLKGLKSGIKVAMPFKMEDFAEYWHFTASQQHQLERLLSRIACLNISTISKKDFQHLRTAKEVLRELENKINLYPLVF